MAAEGLCNRRSHQAVCCSNRTDNFFFLLQESITSVGYLHSSTDCCTKTDMVTILQDSSTVHYTKTVYTNLVLTLSEWAQSYTWTNTSSEISPTRCNNCVFILSIGFTLHVSGDNLTHHQEYICCIWSQVSRLT